MPTEKLTLSVERDAIANGKRYAAANGRSLSAIVGDYLASLDASAGADALPADVRALLGIGTGDQRGNNAGDKDDYRRHLEEKYL